MDDLSTPFGAFPHWLTWGIPASARELREGRSGPVLGRNGLDRIEYLAPCPEFGTPRHRYRFRLYALDTRLRLRRGADRAQLMRAMRGHTLATAQVIGRYGRGAGGGGA